MHKLLEVEEFWHKAILKVIDFLSCNFIIVKKSQGSINPQDGLIYPDYCNI